MNHHRLQTLISINHQQSVFNYFYSRNKNALDGDFLSPKVKSLNFSTGSTWVDESDVTAKESVDKTPLRRAKTEDDSSDFGSKTRKNSAHLFSN